jgi:hypothetical protein
MRPDDANTPSLVEMVTSPSGGGRPVPPAASVGTGGPKSFDDESAVGGEAARCSFAPEEVERIVRDAVSGVAKCPFNDWPADRPLAESPDMRFDSVTRLEMLIWIERGLGVESVPMSQQEMDTIGDMTAWLLEWQGGGTE